MKVMMTINKMGISQPFRWLHTADGYGVDTMINAFVNLLRICKVDIELFNCCLIYDNPTYI